MVRRRRGIGDRLPASCPDGSVDFFGSLSAAVPFLLDLFRIPADTFQLFLATGVVNSRFSATRIARYLVVTIILSAATLGGLRSLFVKVFQPGFAGEELVYSMRPIM